MANSLRDDHYILATEWFFCQIDASILWINKNILKLTFWSLSDEGASHHQYITSPKSQKITSWYLDVPHPACFLAFFLAIAKYLFRGETCWTDVIYAEVNMYHYYHYHYIYIHVYIMILYLWNCKYIFYVYMVYISGVYCQCIDSATYHLFLEPNKSIKSTPLNTKNPLKNAGFI